MWAGITEGREERILSLVAKYIFLGNLLLVLRIHSSLDEYKSVLYLYFYKYLY